MISLYGDSNNYDDEEERKRRQAFLEGKPYVPEKTDFSSNAQNGQTPTENTRRQAEQAPVEIVSLYSETSVNAEEERKRREAFLNPPAPVVDPAVAKRQEMVDNQAINPGVEATISAPTEDKRSWWQKHVSQPLSNLKDNLFPGTDDIVAKTQEETKIAKKVVVDEQTGKKRLQTDAEYLKQFGDARKELNVGNNDLVGAALLQGLTFNLYRPRSVSEIPLNSDEQVTQLVGSTIGSQATFGVASGLFAKIPIVGEFLAAKTANPLANWIASGIPSTAINVTNSQLNPALDGATTEQRLEQAGKDIAFTYAFHILTGIPQAVESAAYKKAPVLDFSTPSEFNTIVKGMKESGVKLNGMSNLGNGEIGFKAEVPGTKGDRFFRVRATPETVTVGAKSTATTEELGQFERMLNKRKQLVAGGMSEEAADAELQRIAGLVPESGSKEVVKSGAAAGLQKGASVDFAEIPTSKNSAAYVFGIQNLFKKLTGNEPDIEASNKVGQAIDNAQIHLDGVKQPVLNLGSTDSGDTIAKIDVAPLSDGSFVYQLQADVGDNTMNVAFVAPNTETFPNKEAAVAAAKETMLGWLESVKTQVTDKAVTQLANELAKEVKAIPKDGAITFSPEDIPAPTPQSTEPQADTGVSPESGKAGLVGAETTGGRQVEPTGKKPSAPSAQKPVKNPEAKYYVTQLKTNKPGEAGRAYEQVEVKGKSVTVPFIEDAFIHRGRYSGWVVSEGSTGTMIGTGKTQAAAIADATEKLNQAGEKALPKLLAEARKVGGESPRVKEQKAALSTKSKSAEEYRGSHQVDTSKSKPASSVDVDKAVSEARKTGYITNSDASDIRKFKKMSGNPDMEVKVYRATPVNELNPGDWVTTSKTYADDIRNQNGGKVYSFTVKAGELAYPNDRGELPSLARFSSFSYNPSEPTSTPVSQDKFEKDRKSAKTIYRTIGFSREGDIQPENAGLRILEEQAATPAGKEAAKAEFEKLVESGKATLNDDGTVTVYRGGKPVDENELISVSLSKEAAAEFGAVKEFRIKPEDIGVASGLDPLEMLVQKEALKKGKVVKDEIIEPPKGSKNASIGTYRDGTPILSTTEKFSTLNPIQLPELVDLATSLVESVKVRKMKSTKQGHFDPGNPKGEIVLNQDLFSDPEKAAKTLAHEIGHAIDWLPDKDMSRGNILGRINSLHKFLKGTYGEGEISNKDVRKELWELSQYWRPVGDNPSDSFLSYRKSSSELYADAISVLFNSPGLLEEKAPLFFNSFLNALDNKPQVKSDYFKLQSLLHGDPDMVVDYRRAKVSGAQGMFQAGDLKSGDLEKLRRDMREKRRGNLTERLLQEWSTIHRPFEKKVKQVSKVMKGEVPDSPIPALRELNYMGGKLRGMVKEQFEPVYKELERNGMSWNDLGEILFYERVLKGDRQKMANPGGLQPEFVQDMYGDSVEPDKAVEANINSMKGALGKEKFAKLQELAVQYRSELKKIFEEGHKAGLYTDDLKATFDENEFYVPFRSVKHLDSKSSFGVKQQKGTLGDITNPATAGIEKAIEIVKAIETNSAKTKAIDFLNSYFSDEVQAAKTVFDGKKMRPLEPTGLLREKGLELVTYFKQGKMVGVYVDEYIADSLNRSSIESNLATVQILSAANKSWFRPVFTSLNLGFQSFNFVRDLKRFYKNAPDMTMVKALKLYARSFPAAYARGFGKDNDLVEAMYKEKVINQTLNEAANAATEDTTATQMEHIMGQLGLAGKSAPEKNLKLHKKVWNSVIDLIGKIGDTIESVPKVAGYIHYREGNGGAPLTPKQRDDLRRYIGSPDFLDKGKVTPASNNILLFSNAIIQGLRSDAELAVNPRTRAGYWFKTAKVSLLPKILMLAATAGLFGAEIKDVYDKASEYDKANYTIIPLGHDENGKAIYMRVPEDETGRFISAIFWKVINSGNNDQSVAKDIGDVISLMGGQIPGVTPALGIAGDWFSFLSGQNPYDDFRQRNIFTDQQFAAGGSETLVPFLKWQFSKLGGNTIMNLSYTDQSLKDQSTVEKSLKTPGISNVVGRWIKVTDYGETEKVQKQLKEIKQEEARRLIEEKDVINDFVKQYKEARGSNPDSLFLRKEYGRKAAEQIMGGTPSTPEEKDRRDAIVSRFQIATKAKLSEGLETQVLYAGSNDSKVAILAKIKEDKSAEEYDSFVQDLYDAGIISKQIWLKVRQ